MSLEDLFFVAAFASAPAILALAACGIFLVPRPKWVTAFALVNATVMAGAFVTYWVLWGRAFDYADTYRPVPKSIDQASTIAAMVFAATLSLFLLTAIATFIRFLHGRRQPAVA
ncbi:MAG: hypothetical protein ACRDTZ_02380 [Pseudonocardiaceae bacterium]